MPDSANPTPPALCALRVLIVDNDPKKRADHQRNLKRWGYIPVVAEGAGKALCADAARKARERRCQVALVDMRLMDDHDRGDWSGLELVPDLKPAAAIIVSGFDDRQAVVKALTEYGAVNFVGKEDGPARLREAIEKAARTTCACRHNALIGWSHGLSSAGISAALFPGDADLSPERRAPPDEADELICRMFPNARRIQLELITSSTQLADDDTAMRRTSLVFKAVLDDNPAFLVIKLTRAPKIDRETRNYETYVNLKFAGLFLPVMYAHTSLWDIGGVAYTNVGAYTASPDWPRTFAQLYRESDRADSILQPIRHFFDTKNWGYWYSVDADPAGDSLFAVYNRSWNGALSKQLPCWEQEEPTLRFDGLPMALPNPMRWLCAHHGDGLQMPVRQTVTHGDLHGDNLFVDSEGHAWPIDFERSGPGPILRDFVELVQDVLTRLARIDDTVALYNLVVALCDLTVSKAALRSTDAIDADPEARKAFLVIRALLHIAYNLARHDDQREYLLGLLLNCLFVATKIPSESPRHAKNMLVASIICARLDHWPANGRRAESWPPPEWPAVGWVAAKRRGGRQRAAPEVSAPPELLAARAT